MDGHSEKPGAGSFLWRLSPQKGACPIPTGGFSEYPSTFTLVDQLNFANISGDHNPMHVDPQLARRFIFGSPVETIPRFYI